MEKYKICPSCKTKNMPNIFECINCETDLTQVKITDEETQRMIETNNVKNIKVGTSFVRICECGQKNQVNARKCNKCGEDIFDITPIPDFNESIEVKKEKSFILSSLDGQYTYEIKSDRIVIGRENVMSDYLLTKSYVSRSHAKLYLENNQLYIENLSNTNFTYINNAKILEKTKLNNLDEIGLGGKILNGSYQEYAAYFKVIIEEK